MNKVAQYYRELVASLSERLRNGERDIDALVEQARERVIKTGELTRTEVDELTRAVRRDLEEFAMSYEESLKEESDSVFMRVIKESLWQELADITDKTQLESRRNVQPSPAGRYRCSSTWTFCSCRYKPVHGLPHLSLSRYGLSRHVQR